MASLFRFLRGKPSELEQLGENFGKELFWLGVMKHFSYVNGPFFSPHPVLNFSRCGVWVCNSGKKWGLGGQNKF